MYYPHYYDAWHYHGDLLYKLKKFNRAARIYHRMTEMKPDDPVAYRKLGKSLMAIGKNQSARRALDKSLKVAPADWTWREDVSNRLSIIRQREAAEATSDPRAD